MVYLWVYNGVYMPPWVYTGVYASLGTLVGVPASCLPVYTAVWAGMYLWYVRVCYI